MIVNPKTLIQKHMQPSVTLIGTHNYAVAILAAAREIATLYQLVQEGGVNERKFVHLLK